jgi:hypothetical protein
LALFVFARKTKRTAQENPFHCVCSDVSGVLWIASQRVVQAREPERLRCAAVSDAHLQATWERHGRFISIACKSVCRGPNRAKNVSRLSARQSAALPELSEEVLVAEPKNPTRTDGPWVSF